MTNVMWTLLLTKVRRPCPPWLPLACVFAVSLLVTIAAAVLR